MTKYSYYNDDNGFFNDTFYDSDWNFSGGAKSFLDDDTYPNDVVESLDDETVYSLLPYFSGSGNEKTMPMDFSDSSISGTDPWNGSISGTREDDKDELSDLLMAGYNFMNENRKYDLTPKGNDEFPWLGDEFMERINNRNIFVDQPEWNKVLGDYLYGDLKPKDTFRGWADPIYKDILKGETPEAYIAKETERIMDAPMDVSFIEALTGFKHIDPEKSFRNILDQNESMPYWDAIAQFSEDFNAPYSPVDYTALKNAAQAQSMSYTDEGMSQEGPASLSAVSGLESSGAANTRVSDHSTLHFDGENVYWVGNDNNIEAYYPALSGPYGNGALPPGDYDGTYLRTRTMKGMYCEKDASGKPIDGWSLNIDPSVDNGGKYLRIHPDGGDYIGTSGCIGVECGEPADRLYNDLKGYLYNHDHIDVAVSDDQCGIPRDDGLYNNLQSINYIDDTASYKPDDTSGDRLYNDMRKYLKNY